EPRVHPVLEALERARHHPREFLELRVQLRVEPGRKLGVDPVVHGGKIRRAVGEDHSGMRRRDSAWGQGLPPAVSAPMMLPTPNRPHRSRPVTSNPEPRMNTTTALHDVAPRRGPVRRRRAVTPASAWAFGAVLLLLLPART